jgi:hypothetical protein
MVLLAVLVVASAVFLFYYHRISDLADDHERPSRNRYPAPRYDVRGFRFDGHREDRRTITIKADRFSIQKKKLGFFRFGLMNVARLENAFVDIYGGRPKPEDSNTKVRSSQHENRSAPEDFKPRAVSSQNFTFGDVFAKNALLSFPVKRLSSVVLEPVRVRLHDEQSVVTEIWAASATIRLKKRDVLFTGGVRLVSGSKILTTSELVMAPERGVLLTNQGFKLETPEKELQGQGLTTDILLTPLRE